MTGPEPGDRMLKKEASPTVAFAFIHFADEKDSLLVHAHSVFVWTEQLLHVALCRTKTQNF